MIPHHLKPTYMQQIDDDEQAAALRDSPDTVFADLIASSILTSLLGLTCGAGVYGLCRLAYMAGERMAR